MSLSPTTHGELPRAAWPTLGALAVAALAFRLATAAGYGIFRDELYYLACAQHLDWGYVDHPPLVAVLAWLARHLLGESLLALRTLPALAGAATVLLVGLLARELGGGRLAQTLAGLFAALTPAYLTIFHMLTMNAFDVLIVSGCLLVLARLLRGGSPRLWLLFGALAGVGLQNKLSPAFLAVALLPALLLGPAAARAQLRSPWLWAGAALALLVFLPHLLWQRAHGWPTVEFMANARQHKMLVLSPLGFLGEHALELQPLLLPLWLSALLFYFRDAAGRAFRALGWVYVALLALIFGSGGKPYYLAPFLPVLLAAGAVMGERLAARRWARPWLAPGLLGLVLLTSLALAPLAVPLLPLERFVRYQQRLGLKPGVGERHAAGRLPQLFADMHGWRELAERVAAVQSQLSSDEQRRACVFTENYGQAGAIDFFGPALRLPPALSGHNSYHLWGTRSCDASVLIVVGGQRARLEPLFASVRKAAMHRCADCMPYEDRKPIWICRGLRRPLAELWPQLKHFI